MGSPECLECPPATYSDEFASPMCTRCSDGMFAPIGSRACSSCPLHMSLPPRFWGNATNASFCVCDEVNDRFPVPAAFGGGCGCQRGHFYSVDAQACEQCPTGTSSVPGAERCDVCALGYFLRDLRLAPSEASCVSCVSGVSCDWNSTLQTIKMRPGYWRLSELTLDIWACPQNGSACLGGSTTGRCVEGQVGPLCRVCSMSNEYYDTETGWCQACPDVGSRMGLSTGVLIGALGCTLVLRLLSRHPERGPRGAAAFLLAALGVVRICARKAAALGLRPKLKVGDRSLAQL